MLAVEVTEFQPCSSNLQDLLLLGFADSLGVIDKTLCQFVDLLLGPALVILADHLFVQEFFDVSHSVAADVPERHFALLDVAMNEFDEMSSPFLSQWWNCDPNDLPVISWIQPELGFHDRFFNGRH